MNDLPRLHGYEWQRKEPGLLAFSLGFVLEIDLDPLAGKLYLPDGKEWPVVILTIYT